jgi:nitrogen regulatory protein PII-like uncharacterized protein
MNAAASNVLPNRTLAEHGIFGFFLTILAGFFAYASYRNFRSKEKGSRAWFILSTIMFGLILIASIIVYKKRLGLADVFGMAKNKATAGAGFLRNKAVAGAGFVQGKYTNWQASRAAVAGPGVQAPGVAAGGAAPMAPMA